MPSQIRVLYVVDSLQVGGVREVLVDQLSKLDADRFEVGVLTLGDDLAEHGHLLPSRVSAMGAPYRPAYGYGLLDYLADGYLLRAARRFGGQALGEIERFAPHILHFHTNPRELGLGILARRRSAVALVFTDHSVRIRPDDYSWYARLLLGAAYRRLYWRYHVISVGPTVARFDQHARLLNPSKRHLLLENQIDLGRFYPPGSGRADPPEIIYVGRIDPAKGLDTLIRAYARLRLEPAVRLVLVGPDGMDGEMQSLAEQCIAPPLQVDFLGVRSDVPALLRRASIAVLASRREGLSLTLLEQMASSLPVVVSDIPELTDIVTHDVNGLVVPAGDVEALADALRRLVEAPELRAQLGRAARETVERRRAADSSGQLAQFYEDVAKPVVREPRR